MPDLQQPATSAIKFLRLLYLSLLAGQIIFAGIVVYLVFYAGFEAVFLKGEKNDLLSRGLITALSIALTAFSFYYYKKKAETLKNAAVTNDQKLKDYRVLNIVRWAMLEAATLINIIGFLLTGRQSLLIVVLALLLVFFSTRPTATKMEEEIAVA